MISASELQQYIATLKDSGVVGRVKIGDIEVTIAPTVDRDAPQESPKKLSAEYDRMLFAATEGIPDDVS